MTKIKNTKKKKPLSDSKKQTVSEAGASKAKAISEQKGILEAIRPRQGLSWKLVLLFLFFIGIGAAYITWSKWNSAVPKWMLTAFAPQQEPDKAKLIVSRVNKLAASVFKLEKNLDAINGELTNQSSETKNFMNTATNNLDRRMKKLEDKFVAVMKLKTLNKSHISTEISNQSKEKFDLLLTENKKLQLLVKNFNNRLEALEARPKKHGNLPKGNTLLLAIGQLRGLVASSSSFQEALETVIVLGKDESALTDPIEILSEHAEKGVPEFGQLKNSFGKIVGAIIRASNAPKNHGWVDKVLEKVKNSITIRPVGHKAAERKDLFGQIARAELRMDSGDLKGAVKIVSALEKKIRKPAENWLTLARARLSVNLAISQLFSKALILSKELRSGIK